ncbi:MAG: DNA repair protein RecN [Anaerolineales bacterium]
MLSELHIKNFAIIQELDLLFDPGLIVLTGETGAGKSIIMGALDMLLGKRVDMTNLRSGSERAAVEAVFHIPEAVREPIHSLLNKEDMLDDPEYVTLSRELRRDRRNVARVNGHRANVGLLVRLGEQLVDIHGQSDHLSLLRVNQHLKLLDRYAGNEDEFASYQDAYQKLKGIRSEVKRLRELDREAEKRLELLEFQVDEIQAANLVRGEDEELSRRLKRLANAEKLVERCQEALMLLEDAPPSQPTITDLFGQFLDAVTAMVKSDPSLEELAERTKDVSDGLEELNLELRSYLDSLEFDPQELERVEERLALIRDLKRKYGETIPAVLDHADQSKLELETITDRSERIAELEKQQSQVLQDLAEKGKQLSTNRKEAAERLEGELEGELEDLRMAESRFRVAFRQTSDPQGVLIGPDKRVKFTANGLEEVEFLIETNPGEGFKPLAKIASGGEMARLMLAIKHVLAKADRISTLVFDEIDQGIGGRIGAVVGEKLRRLTGGHQVICITHLPQLASFGQQHYQVSKQVVDQRTLIHVHVIKGEERLRELAQMLGGVSEHTLQSAKELLHAVDSKVERMNVTDHG